MDDGCARELAGKPPFWVGGANCDTECGAFRPLP
jgi:hypothetical protein